MRELSGSILHSLCALNQQICPKDHRGTIVRGLVQCSPEALSVSEDGHIRRAPSDDSSAKSQPFSIIILIE